MSEQCPWQFSIVFANSALQPQVPTVIWLPGGGFPYFKIQLALMCIRLILYHSNHLSSKPAPTNTNLVHASLLQIELYSHVGAIRSVVDYLRNDGWNVAAVFCMDVAFVYEPTKYIAGAMQVSTTQQQAYEVSQDLAA